jgi:hypothetical protein
MSAGARLTVMRLGGSEKPMALSAARTRSRDSATALSGRPTMVKPGVPGDRAHCTSTSRASMPSKATLWQRDVMGRTLLILARGIPDRDERAGPSKRRHWLRRG